MGVVREHTAGPDPGSGEQVAHRIPLPHGELAEHPSPTSAEPVAGLATKAVAVATSSSRRPRRLAASTAIIVARDRDEGWSGRRTAGWR
jgi:hypothetical protein